MRTAVFGLMIILLVWSSDPGILALDPSRSIHQYALSLYKGAEGLPQNSVTGIVQTSDGYLWLGTFDGLVRFDGIHFTAFNPVELFGAQNKVVTALSPRKAGGFYIVTSGTVGIYDAGHFAAVPVKEDLSKKVVQVLHEDRNGVLWMGTHNSGLLKFENGRLVVFSLAEGLSHENVRDIDEDLEGNLWIGTAKGLNRLSQGKFTRYGSGDGLKDEYVLSLHVDPAGRFWVGTRGGGLHLYQNGRFHVLSTSKDADTSSITCLASETNGSLWLGTLRGLQRLRQGQFETLVFSGEPSQTSVRSLFCDREGNLWVGTNGGGLARLKDGKFITYTTREGLSNNVVMSIYGDESGRLWMGTNCGGLNVFQDGRFRNYTTRDGLSDDCIWTVYGDRQGSIWMGTFSAGLNRLRDGKITALTVRDGLPSNDTRALLVDRKDRLWVGTRNGLSLIEQGKITNYTTAHGLSSGDIRALREDREGAIWIGTYGAGLSRFKEGQFTSYSRRDGLPCDYVLSIYDDREGKLWIGTNGGGLARMHQNRFFTYSVKDGLPADNIFQILEDDSGNLWMSYAKGIFRVSLQQLNDYADGRIPVLNPIHYERYDGLPEDGIQGGFQPAGWKDSHGVLWFPSVGGGLVSIDPAREKSNPVPPLLALEKLMVDGQQVPGGPPVILPPEADRLEFHYTGLSLQAPEKIQFRYKLEGYDEDWIDAGRQRVAVYTRVPPGDYTFHVIASNNDGVWNDEGAIFPFRVEPHFYQTGIFYFLCALALVSGIAAVFYLRVRNINAQRIKLKEEVDKAMAEIKTLSGLLPICASCKKIRDDKGYWNQIETYITSRSDAKFSHGICPECVSRLYPELYPDISGKSPQDHS